MDARLDRLVQLFSDSLERDLTSELEAELKGLLEDAHLVEAFGQWQASRSPTDGADPGATPELDRKVRSLFRSKNYLLRHWQAFLAGTLGLGLAGLFIKAVEKRQPEVVPVVVEDAALEVQDAPAAVEPARRPTLSLPPGYGIRPRRLESRSAHSVDLRWTLEENAQAAVRVYDEQDRLVRTVWQGHAESGRYTNTWNGRDEAGRLVEPGRYRLQAESGGRVLARKTVRLDARPQ
jgi:hypothetical protein